MTTTNEKELLAKLIDDDEVQDIELQKEPPMIAVVGVPVKKTSSKKKHLGKRICKCLGITMLILILLSIFAGACLIFWMRKVLDDLTVETPQKFPIVYKSDDELYDVIMRMEHFYDAVVEGESNVEDLVVEQDEMNGFIAHSDYLRGNAMVTFEEERIVEQFSLPMKELGFGDRYLVGNDYFALKKDKSGDGEGGLVEMKVETEAKHEGWFDGPLIFLQMQYFINKSKMDEGRTMLEIFLEKGSFFGNLIPQEVIDEREDLMEPFLDGLDLDDSDLEDAIHFINGIESYSIESGKIVFKARTNDINN